MTMHQSLILMVRSVNRISIFGLLFNRAYSGCCCQRTFHRLYNARRRQKKQRARKEMKALNVIILEMFGNKGAHQICIKVKEREKKRNQTYEPTYERMEECTCTKIQNRNVSFVFLCVEEKKITKWNEIV